MDKTPLIVVLIEERVQNKKIAAALIRTYNNLIAKTWSWLLVLIGIVGYAMYKVFVDAASFDDLLNNESWKMVILIAVKEILELFKSARDKANRTQ